MEKKEETLMKLKRRNCAAFIKRSLQTITQVEGKVNCYELSSPLTTQHFVNYERRIYGLDHSPSRTDNPFKTKNTNQTFLFNRPRYRDCRSGRALFSRIVYYGNYGKKCTEKL
jgi:all-trans-retinol 13,14-reductase